VHEEHGRLRRKWHQFFVAEQLFSTCMTGARENVLLSCRIYVGMYHGMYYGYAVSTLCCLRMIYRYEDDVTQSFYAPKVLKCRRATHHVQDVVSQARWATTFGETQEADVKFIQYTFSTRRQPPPKKIT
jgi:hypothetical protein